MTTDATSWRRDVIFGLRSMADFLDFWPLPAPEFPDQPLLLTVLVADAESVRVAAMEAKTEVQSANGHTATTIPFTGVSLQYLHVDDDGMSRYRAGTSYADNISAAGRAEK